MGEKTKDFVLFQVVRIVKDSGRMKRAFISKLEGLSSSSTYGVEEENTLSIHAKKNK